MQQSNKLPPPTNKGALGPKWLVFLYIKFNFILFASQLSY